MPIGFDHYRGCCYWQVAQDERKPMLFDRGELSPEAIASRGLILRATVGSTLHGLALEGTDDRDEMGVCIEPPEYVIGLQKFEHFVQRTQPEGVRSGPGDLDLVVYSLRKWARLAANGNPTVLLLLFAPRAHIVKSNHLGIALQGMASAFVSRRAGEAYLGYMVAQRQRLLGERGQRRTKRPELEAAHGYDTKYAMHVLRLGYQGVELLETGCLTLPMAEPLRQHLLGVRQGRFTLNDVLTDAGELEVRLSDLLDTSPLDAEPDRAAIDRFLIAAYQSAWDEQWDAGAVFSKL